MGDAWDRAMQGLSDLELRLIMVGAKRGTMRAVGSPDNAMVAGLKAAMELARREKRHG
jgi:hypothetical protein